MREKRWESRSQDEARSELPLESQRRRKKRNTQPGPVSKASQASSEASSSDSKYKPSKSVSSSTCKTRALMTVDALACREVLPKPTSGRSSRNFIVAPNTFARLAEAIQSMHFTTPSSKKPDQPMSPRSRMSFYKALAHPFSDPRSILSAARTDPFDVLPIRLSTEDMELFDFYVHVMPIYSLGFERHNPYARTWYLSVLIPEAMKGATCFQNMILVHAAKAKAKLYGASARKLVVAHENRASRLLQHQQEMAPHDISNASISAMISAATLEDMNPSLDRRRLGRLHWQVALQKIQNRGGLMSLAQENGLPALIHWSDYTSSGYDTHTLKFDLAHWQLSSRGNDSRVDAAAKEMVMQEFSEFMAFLKYAERNAAKQAGVGNSLGGRRKWRLRVSAFTPGQPLYNLVAGSPGLRYAKSGQFKQSICRLASLMTLNVALLHFGDSPALTDKFLTKLLEMIKKYGLDQQLSHEALVQILLSDRQSDGRQRQKRHWMVGRMLDVAKRLSKTNFEKLNNLLLSFLTLDVSKGRLVEDWGQELHDEVSQAPLVSYQSRFMTE